MGITIICGHYGCGKTNLSVNLALDAATQGYPVTLVDFDIVNPFFRSSDYRDMLNAKGIRVIAPVYAGSASDLPMIPPEVSSIFEADGIVLIDAGGDDAGATVLGSYADKIGMAGYDMLYIVNKYRALSTTAEEAVSLLAEIERASHLKATAIVNNSHLMRDTVPDTVAGSFGFAQVVSATTGLPVRATVVPRSLADRIKAENAGIITENVGYIYPVDIYVRTPWADGD